MSATSLEPAPVPRQGSVRPSIAAFAARVDAAVTAGLVGMTLTRWHGWSLAELCFALAATAGFALRLASPRPLGFRARIVDPALLAIWLVAFGASAWRSEPPKPTLAELETIGLPADFVRQLSTVGPLSVLADETWYREVQSTDRATGLFVVDDGGRTIWLNATPLPTEWETVEDFADQTLRRVEAAEGPLRELERRSDAVDGFPTTERLIAVDDAEELRLLVVTQRDGHLILGWGASPGLDSIADVEAIRRVMRSVRACGDVRDDVPPLVDALGPDLGPRLREYWR